MKSLISTIDNNADSVAGSNSEIDSPMKKGHSLPSEAEWSKQIPNTQNNEAQTSLLIKDDSLTGAWMKMSDSVDEIPHLTNDSIIYNQVLVDPLNISLECAFLTADFTSPIDEHNTIASGGIGTMSIMDSSELMINEATMPERRPTAAITSLPAVIAGILSLRNQFKSLFNKEMASKEESTPHMEAEFLVEEDIVFQIKEGFYLHIISSTLN
jgi:hypothetical protein